MKKLILLSAFLSSSIFAGQELDMLPVADNTLLGESRGMANLIGQDNETAQGGIVAGNDIVNSIMLSGANNISAGASKGIIMINLTSGSNNITNMSTSVNIVSAR